MKLSERERDRLDDVNHACEKLSAKGRDRVDDVNQLSERGRGRLDDGTDERCYTNREKALSTIAITFLAPIAILFIKEINLFLVSLLSTEI